MIRTLILNQTIGLLAGAGLVLALFQSPRIQALVSRTSLGTHVSTWITSRILAVRPADIVFVTAMVALMIGWTVLVQALFARGRK